MLATADIFLFEEFRLDRQRDGLSRRDESGVFVPLSIGSRALDVLSVLVERAGELVSKEDIMAAVWRRTVVENANLTVQIASLRRILDQGRPEGSCIQTVAARGYRFITPVTRAERASPLPVARIEAVVALPIVASALLAAPRQNRARLATIAAALSAALVIAGVAWWVWPASRSQTASPSIAASMPQPIAPRLSIVVLPFTNVGDDREQQQYLADGITEDVTTDLSRVAGLFVISRNTAFTYRSKPDDARQIGRELGVRYVLEGSVRRSGTQVRVSAQLIDAETAAHLWAERFDGDMGDLFALQNDITSRIAVALNQTLVRAEAARPSENPDVVDYTLRGRAALMKAQSIENHAEAISLLERALAIDPRSVEAQIRLAWVLAGRGRASDLERAESLIGQALATSPRDPNAHLTKGRLLRAQRRCDEAISEFEMALALDRNEVRALVGLSMCKFLTGLGDEAIPFAEQAIRLSPRDPAIGFRYAWIGFIHLMQSRTDEAIVWIEKGRRADPTELQPPLFLASAYGLKGELDRAAAELAALHALKGPDYHLSIGRVRKTSYLNTPAVQPRFETIFLAGLRKAGMPEE